MSAIALLRRSPVKVAWVIFAAMRTLPATGLFQVTATNSFGMGWTATLYGGTLPGMYSRLFSGFTPGA